MAKGRGSVNTAGKPRKTSLVAHAGAPASKAPVKKNTLVMGSKGSTGTC